MPFCLNNSSGSVRGICSLLETDVDYIVFLEKDNQRLAVAFTS